MRINTSGVVLNSGIYERDKGSLRRATGRVCPGGPKPDPKPDPLRGVNSILIKVAPY